MEKEQKTSKCESYNGKRKIERRKAKDKVEIIDVKGKEDFRKRGKIRIMDERRTGSGEKLWKA